MGLGGHPGEAEALAALGRVPRLDRAHLERGNALHLEAKDRRRSQPHAGAACGPGAGDTRAWELGSTLPAQAGWGWGALQASRPPPHQPGGSLGATPTRDRSGGGH